MFARKLLQSINVAIGIALISLIGAVYWYAWRPLPRESGSLTARVKAPVRIDRDSLGVPRISAASLEDLFFAQGFATAQDRLWQMESFRRLTAGELAEIAGPAALESDREFRRLRLSRLAEYRAHTVAGEDRAVLAAYARGVNHFIETHWDRLPLEFTLLQIKPRPWRIEDTMLVGLMMQQALGSTYRHDLTREAMYEKGDPARIAQLFPSRTGSEHQPGSNAWAVSGAHTRSGKAALANDMHLGWSLPGIWYMAHLTAPGYHAAGVTIPGIPAIVAGRNENIAWGITNLGFDVQDLYAPASNQAMLERDRIAVRDTPGEPFEQFVNTHGPLFRGPGNKFVALRWAAAEKRPFQLGLVKLNRASNWQEFRDALREFPGAGSNITYADKAGNIGLQVAGILPIRDGCDGHRVYPAGTCEWKGFIPFEELPSFYNPAQGRIVTANQNPFPEDYPYPVSGNFAPHYRSNRILERLQAGSQWTPAAMLELQADIYSPYSHYIATQLTEAFGRRKPDSPQLREAIEILRSWDGQMKAGAAAPLLATYASNHLRRAIAAKAAGTPNVEWEPFIYFAVIEKLLQARPSGWFPDWDQALLDALQNGIEEGALRQGSDLRNWQWGRENQLTLANPVLRSVPWAGGYFQLGPVPLDGSATTVRQVTARLGPSMRLVVDFGDPSGGLLNIPAGQSGHALSSHFKDQWDAYSNATSFPLHFSGGWQSKGVLTLAP